MHSKKVDASKRIRRVSLHLAELRPTRLPEGESKLKSSSLAFKNSGKQKFKGKSLK